MKTFRKTAFTLAEGATHVDICDNIRKCAFTLAEVLITLGIIGVVAAITIPPLVTNITERINSERQANIALKFTKAMENMKALGLLHEYESTDAFVDELQNHIKIAKRCSASNIADCWPTSKVIDSDGEEYDVSKAKKGKHLNIFSNKTDNVGLVLDDGASIILTYKENSEGMDETDAVRTSNKPLPVGFGKTKEFAYTTSVTGSIDFVMDVNGAKGPNSETIEGKYHDIRSFKAAKFGIGCDVVIPEIGCIVILGTNYDKISSCNDSTYDNTGNISRNWYCNDNYWAGAKKACQDLKTQLPDYANMQKIFKIRSEYSDLSTLTGEYYVSNGNQAPYGSCFSFSTGSRNCGNNRNVPKNEQLNVFCIK